MQVGRVYLCISLSSHSSASQHGSAQLSPGDIVPTVTPMTTTLPSLTPGAIAGIAVGTIIGLVMIVGILLLVFLCGVLVAGMWVFSEEMCGYVWDMMFKYKSISRKIPEA